MPVGQTLQPCPMHFSFLNSTLSVVACIAYEWEFISEKVLKLREQTNSVQDTE